MTSTTEATPPIADARCRVSTPGSTTGFHLDLLTRAFQSVECTCADSTAPDGDDIAHCDWEITSPTGEVYAATGTPDEDHVFFLTAVGGWRACVTVTSSRGGASHNSACVEIDAIEESEILCRLTWRHQFEGSTDPIIPNAPPDSSTGCGADLDIHALPSTLDAWFEHPALYYRYPLKQWPGAGSGVLNMDVRMGIGPEIVTIQDPVPGVTYTCAAHYFNDYGWEQYEDAGGWADATMEVVVSGLVVAEYSMRMEHTQQFWEAASITWRSDLPGEDDITTSSVLHDSHCDTDRAPDDCEPMPRSGGTTEPPCWR